MTSTIMVIVGKVVGRESIGYMGSILLRSGNPYLAPVGGLMLAACRWWI